MSEKKKERRAPGTGTVFQDKSSGLWTARLDAINPATGDVESQKVRTKTKEDAEAALELMLDKRARGQQLTTTNMRLGEWLDLWLEKYTKARTPRGKEAQEGNIRRYIKPAIGNVRLRSLTIEDVESVHTLIEGKLNKAGKPLSSSTARQAHVVLRGALKEAKRRKLITENVADDVDLPLSDSVEIPSLSGKEARTLLRATADDRLAARWGLGLLALRQGEALGVRLSSVHLEKKYAYIEVASQLQRIPWKHGCGPERRDGTFECGHKRGAECPGKHIDARRGWQHERIGDTGLYLSAPKSRHGVRSVPLVEPFRSLVADRMDAAAGEPNSYGLLLTQPPKKIQHREEWKPLDGSPINPAADWRAFQAITEAAGLPKVSIHSLRHSTVELLYKLEVPEKTIQEIAGHSVVGTTRKYTKLDRATQDRAARKLGKMLGG